MDNEKIIVLLENILNGGNIEKKIVELKKIIQSSDKNYEQMIYIQIERLIRKFDTQIQIYLYSILLTIDNTPKYLIEILNTCIYDDDLEINSKYFILYQYTHMKFTNNNVSNEQVECLLRKLYYKIYDKFYNTFQNSLEFIVKSTRNKKLIFVFTPQFLGVNHAPTRRVLDRCINLIELGYEVLLINTAEALSIVNNIPIYNAQGANYIKEYSELNSMEYEGYKIPFYQSTHNTPNIAKAMSILGIIQEYKPFMIFSFGNYNITSDLASNIVPVANVPFSYDLPITKATFHVKVGILFDEDYRVLKKFHFDKDSLIRDNPNYHLKKQTKVLTRNELGLPEDKYILALVGNRLDNELDENFINKLLETIDLNTHLVFIGKFEFFDKLAQKNKKFNDNATNLGYQNDIFSIYDHCHLYINPHRSGGGASSVEALSKGVPVITPQYGDVYFGIGKEFGVANTDIMIEKIKELVLDTQEYERMVELSLDRVKVLTNTKNTLEDLIIKITTNKLFL